MRRLYTEDAVYHIPDEAPIPDEEEFYQYHQDNYTYRCGSCGTTFKIDLGYYDSEQDDFICDECYHYKNEL